jgi:hypothetical protein
MSQNSCVELVNLFGGALYDKWEFKKRDAPLHKCKKFSSLELARAQEQCI